MYEFGGMKTTISLVRSASLPETDSCHCADISTMGDKILLRIINFIYMFTLIYIFLNAKPNVTYCQIIVWEIPLSVSESKHMLKHLFLTS